MADPLGSHPVGATRGEGVEDDVEAVAAMEDDRDDSGGGPELPALLPHPAPRKAKSSTATANRVHIGSLPVRVNDRSTPVYPGDLDGRATSRRLISR